MIYITAGRFRLSHLVFPFERKISSICRTAYPPLPAFALENHLGFGTLLERSERRVGDEGVRTVYSFANLGSQKTVSKTATIAIAEPK